ncbi:MAG: hypothetical protein DRN25_00995 [Thermoplasmata archaeon]|nr:MAG: hypothetical protein DRN25_00995 [Thermoplasmata archaeon]
MNVKYKIATMGIFSFFFLLLYSLHGFEEKEIIVEIHDVSPGYGVQKIEKVVSTVSYADEIILFVIPNRDEREPISSYPDFVKLLEKYERRGMIIGAHGYTHNGFEFNCNRSTAIKLVEKSDEEFIKAGFYPTVFCPPRYRMSGEAFEVVRERYSEIHLFWRIIVHNRSIYSITFDPGRGGHPKVILPLIKLSYILYPGKTFRVSIHMGYVTNEESMKTLKEFFEWIKQRHHRLDS